MPELAGFNTVIKISGAPINETMPTNSLAGNLIYQITDSSKRVLSRDGTILVQKRGSDVTAEAGTTNTNIKITAHGLVDNDLIVNVTHSGIRLVTKVDNDNITVSNVSGQTTGDTIQVYKTELSSAYILDRLDGKITYPSAAVREIRITGEHLPMTVAAYANQSSQSYNCDVKDVPVFGATYKKRIPTLKYASGSLTQFNIADTTYSDALVAGNPIVIEHRAISTDEPNRFWALLNSDELQSAIDGVQAEVVTWISTDAWLRLSV